MRSNNESVPHVAPVALRFNAPLKRPVRDAMKRQTNRVPPPRLYLYFDAIVQHGSIRAAAENMRVAPSALSRRLLELEREAGATLFDRSQGGVQLTAAGEIFAAHVRRTLTDIAQVAEKIQALHDRSGGHVTNGVADGAASDWLAPAVVAFQQSFPNIRFSVSAGTPQALLDALLEDHVDLILTYDRPCHHDVRIVSEAQGSFCAVMRPDHKLATRSSLCLQDCQDIPLVLPNEPSVICTMIEEERTFRNISLNVAMVSDQPEILKHYVRLTDALTFQFRLGSGAEAPTGGFLPVPLIGRFLNTSRVFLAVRRHRVLPPSAATVCERFSERLAHLAGGGVMFRRLAVKPAT